MKAFKWSVVFGGVIIAIIAGLVVDWIERRSASQTANDAAWSLTLSRFTLPNLNTRPESPASAYPNGAPTPTYRPVLQIGSAQVPTA